jgi:hypothetical protein
MALNVAVASMITGSARAEGYELCLTASLHEAMADECISYLRTIGTLSTQASHHAGRTHANMLDVLAALRIMHSTASHGLLLAFAASHVLDPSTMPGTLPAMNRAFGCCLKCVSHDHKQVQVPEFLPTFPKSHTFNFTPTRAARRFDNATIRKHVSKLRRAADLKMLQHRSAPTAFLQSTPLILDSVDLMAPSSSVFPVAEHKSLAAVVALPYKNICRKQLMTVQDKSSMISNKHGAILQQQHVHGFDEATHEGARDEHGSASA